MSERESWMPSDDEIANSLAAYIPGSVFGIHDLIRSAVEKAVADESARHEREIEALRQCVTAADHIRDTSPNTSQSRLDDYDEARAAIAAMEESK